MTDLAPTLHFPYRDIALRVALSAGIGLLVGLEREWSQKEIGVRTFAIAGLLGMITSLFPPMFVVAGLLGILLLAAFLNIHSLLKDRSLELTTALCLIVVFFLGALVGEGHNFTAATSAIAMMMLLAWKRELERLAGALRPEEIRSAVLLGLLSVVIYPLLPDQYIDKWHLVNPRQAWTIVVVIAGIGFINYSLLRIYSNRGLYYAAVLGGLVNSTAAVAELANSLKQQDGFADSAVPVLLLTSASMFVRNAIILAIFAPASLGSAGAPLAAMTGLTLVYAWINRAHDSQAGAVRLSSPVSLRRVLKFGALFLLLSAIGTLAQRYFGSFGFLVVAALGGLISSASTAATAAALAASGSISPFTAGMGTVFTSISSALVDLPLIYQQTHDVKLTRKLTIASAGISLIGMLSLLVERWMIR